MAQFSSLDGGEYWLAVSLASHSGSLSLAEQLRFGDFFGGELSYPPSSTHLAGLSCSAVVKPEWYLLLVHCSEVAADHRCWCCLCTQWEVREVLPQPSLLWRFLANNFYPVEEALGEERLVRVGSGYELLEEHLDGSGKWICPSVWPINLWLSLLLTGH